MLCSVFRYIRWATEVISRSNRRTSKSPRWPAPSGYSVNGETYGRYGTMLMAKQSEEIVEVNTGMCFNNRLFLPLFSTNLNLKAIYDSSQFRGKPL